MRFIFWNRYKGNFGKTGYDRNGRIEGYEVKVDEAEI